MRREKYLFGSYYHISNRGVDSRQLFVSKEDYDRFESYLHILNDAESSRPANFFLKKNRGELGDHRKVSPLVAIGAYSLVPGSFQIVLTPVSENGIPQFMQKLSTAYSMYFNDKYQRAGRLFEGTYKCKLAASDKMLRYFFGSVHLAPAQLFRKDWEDASIIDLESMSAFLMDYRYSSIGEYLNRKFVIIDPQRFPRFARTPDHIDHYIRFWFDYNERQEK